MAVQADGGSVPFRRKITKFASRFRLHIMWKSIVAIAIGAALGALLRWHLGNRLNAVFPSLPPGTLLANLIGAYLIGLAIAFFSSYPAISPEWRLLIVTGFCGGLTTFSAFSAEITALLQQGQALWAAGAIAGHVAGSVLMTLAGIGTWRGVRHFW
jgi:CrcB protein